MKARELIPYRHSLFVQCGDAAPYWCMVVCMRWGEDLKSVVIMLDNHCFITYPENHEIDVRDNGESDSTGLPSKSSVLATRVAKAKLDLAEAEKDLLEAVECLKKLEGL